MRNLHAGVFVAGAALLVVAGIAACGGGSSSSSSPSSSTTVTTVPSGPSAATITITSSGVSPRSVTVPRGSRVTFVNNDGSGHEMTSDPHPTHTDCPALNVMGTIGAGQSGQSDLLSTARTCNYHDHIRPTEAAWQGTIVVQ